MFQDPLRVAPAIHHRPDHSFIRLTGVAAQKPAVITKGHPVNPRGDLKAIDVSTQTGGEVIAKSMLMDFVEQETVVQIGKGFRGDADAGHR